MAKAKKDCPIQTVIDIYTKEMLEVVEKESGLGISAIMRMAIIMYLNNWFALNNKKLPKAK